MQLDDVDDNGLDAVKYIRNQLEDIYCIVLIILFGMECDNIHTDFLKFMSLNLLMDCASLYCFRS